MGSVKRLLHVRCFSKKQHLDLVCVYQHALPFEAGALKTTLAKRKQLWNKLDSLLQSFPVRSSVVVAGDFNSNLCSSGSCIGHSVLHNAAKSTVVEERRWLSGLLASHQLTALNSWSRKLPTYWHPSGSSQIDWILVRSSLADSCAKKCTPSDAPVAGWRSAGHKVLKASIPLNWMPWRISGSRTEKALVSSRNEAPDASPLQKVIQEVSGSEVPARQIPARPGFVGVDGEILQFWQVRKLLSQHRIASLRDVFVRMRLVLKLQRRRRELQAAVRARKRQQLLETLQLAENASKTGDSRTLYQCVRWLAPRNIRRTIRLRDEQGLLLHPKDECKLLADYAGDLFRARRGTDIPQLQLSPLDPSIFSPALWVSAIGSLRVGKAVWATLRTAVERLFASGCCEVESSCHRCLVLLRSQSPYRMVDCSAGLAGEGGENTFQASEPALHWPHVCGQQGVLDCTSLRTGAVEQAMYDHPQYAYRKGASAADALMRAAGHCSTVRLLLQRHRHDQTSRLLGEAAIPCAGGLMCGLDLQKAFDALPHSELHDAMIDAGVPEPLAATINYAGSCPNSVRNQAWRDRTGGLYV